jgi:TRAP-type C4-dicarboxylate transport system substrate-binding protein
MRNNEEIASMQKIAVWLGLAAGLAFAASASAQTKWNLPAAYPVDNPHTENLMQFAKDVHDATGGKLQIAVHPGASLFKAPDIKRAVQTGQAPIGERLLSAHQNENALFAFDSVPFLATSYDDAQRLWEASREPTAELLGEQGLKILFAVPWPPQGLYADKEIDTVDDLKGVKFRAYNTATERLAQLAGAVPTQVEVPDIAQAFATGRVDAMMTSPSTGVESKAWDFVSHFYNTQAYLPKNIVVVNQDTFDGLDPAVQRAVLDAAAKAQERGRQMSMKETEKQIAVLEENGMQVQEPGKELAAGLHKIGETMTEEWAKQAGDPGAAILEAYEK